jgi:hypothetical protein
MRAWSVSAEAEKKGLQDSLDGAHNTARKLTAQIEELTDDKQKREMDIQVRVSVHCARSDAVATPLGYRSGSANSRRGTCTREWPSERHGIQRSGQLY